MVMGNYSGPCIFVPCNFDVYYISNSQYLSNNNDEWDYARVTQRLDKADAIRVYLWNRFGREVKRNEDAISTENGN